jgi:hypothetical protein
VSILRNLEQKLEGLFEGAFSKTFKSKVQPVEIARKLAKEMQDNKTVSIARTYVPNQYVVWLSTDDRSQFEGYEDGLKKELSDYLLEHARGEGLALLTRPTVEFQTDERLGLGEFGIQAMLVRPPEEERPQAEPEPAEFGHTMVYSVDREARRMDAPASYGGRAMLIGGGKRTVLSGSRVVLGRSRDCDVTLDDPNVSRRHAELRREGSAWVVSDLGSTNGVKVNGRRVNDHPLTPGDEIVLGLERLTFEVQ